jgi:DNA-directed RNA polymerase specialized sigma24 family protein
VVVELCYLKQIRYREAAAVLGLPVGTIGTRLMRARVQLRALLTTTSLDVVNQ